MDHVWMEQNVTEVDKFERMERLLNDANFYEILSKKCQSKKTCKIVIKPNVAIATQKKLKNYTDPELVGWLVDAHTCWH